MPATFTPQQMAAKLQKLHTDEIPALEQAMKKACLNVEGLSKEYCTPGKSPYYKAPYSDDNDPRRKPPHMRDTIEGKVAEVTASSVIGVVGTPKDYAIHVHEGTSRMQARPFILDAIKEKEDETLEILGDATVEVIRRQCVT
jgi:hypothetical protein